MWFPFSLMDVVTAVYRIELIDRFARIQSLKFCYNDSDLQSNFQRASALLGSSPLVFGIPALQLLFQFRIRVAPEVTEVFGDLHRAVAGSEDLDAHADAALRGEGMGVTAGVYPYGVLDPSP